MAKVFRDSSIDILDKDKVGTNMTERNTIQKKLVLDSVAKLHNHPTAEEVYDFIHGTHPSVSKATVYRNLRQLSDSGKLKRIESVNLADHYDHQCHDHYHIQCTKCNRVHDMDLDYMEDLDNKATVATDFKVESHDIVFRGLCPQCQKKTNNKNS